MAASLKKPAAAKKAAPKKAESAPAPDPTPAPSIPGMKDPGAPGRQSIHLALAAIMRDVDAIYKDKKNTQQGFNFRGIDDVYNALHPIFAAHGVVCIPFLEKLEVDIPGLNAKGNLQFRSFAFMGYRFHASDGSFVEAKTVGEGLDYGDKATAKAMSVAHKYLLLQTFLIPTEDVIDGDNYAPTVMPREELARLAEERAREAVMSGGNIELPPDQAEALRKKRESMTGELPEGATAVEGQRMMPEVPNGDEPAYPQGEQQPPAQTRQRRQRRAADKPEGKPADTAAAPQTPPEAPAKPTPAPKAEEPAATGWRGYTITQIKMQEYENQRLGGLKPGQIHFLKEKWGEKYADKIKLNPQKTADFEQIKLAYAELLAAGEIKPGNYDPNTYAATA